VRFNSIANEKAPNQAKTALKNMNCWIYCDNQAASHIKPEKAGRKPGNEASNSSEGV
jgi:hypothetical protein